jgi:integrase
MPKACHGVSNFRSESVVLKISPLSNSMGEMMGKRQVELGALAISKIRRRGINFVGGVTGLAINVSGCGSRSWVLRYTVNGRRRDKGLGGYPSVSLAQAKELARTVRAKLAQGIDPVDDGQLARQRLIVQHVAALSFREAANQYIDTHGSSWRNPKHIQQWRNTIDSYANPIIGSIPVADVALSHIMLVLEPIWKSKTETASRLRGRLESVLDWATARGHRTDANPARWKGFLDKLLPAPGKIAKISHHRALPYAKLPQFMVLLAGQQGMGARALEFAILTGSRSGEVRHATWPEFDFDAGTWTIPASRMKAGKEHRVPLSDAALAIVRALKATAFCEYVFPSSHLPRSKNPSALGVPLSDMTLSSVLRRMEVAAVPHGFRSTFRDWAAEKTDYPREVAEMALAHTIGDKVEAAYRRGDLFEKRRQFMQDWATYACLAAIA